MKLILYLSALLSAGISFAQQPVHFSVRNTTFAAADSLLPFWFTANSDGKVRAGGSLLNLTDLYIGRLNPSSGSAFGYTWGVNGVAAIGETNYYQLNRAFGGIFWKGWELTGGLFYDPMHDAGLSSTNGNLVRSRNARPYPRLRLATMGYKPVPFLQNRLQFKAEYDEGLLNDERFVIDTRLHHKSFYLRVPVAETWMLEGGLEHYVMWGGTSPVEKIGKMPARFNAYLQYITGSSGDDSFPPTDRMNVAGNQLGTYQFKATRQFSRLGASFFLSHPFEDLSGMNGRNYNDNLLGLYLRFNNRRHFITDVVTEYTSTRQQSIRGQWDRQEPDNYFNNGVYRSGFTYHRQVMGSPLFFPVRIHDGISAGIESNRFVAGHLGIKGLLNPHLLWKGMFTFVSHSGNYFSPYKPRRRQFSTKLELRYVNPALPVELGLSTAADAGNAVSSNAGLQFWIAKKWKTRERSWK